ncbi:MAG TPA: DUF892 family protein [Mucilaginibacter sp.]|nr:DUF892 family protein [Mucilaginibacter sp.]
MRTIKLIHETMVDTLKPSQLIDYFVDHLNRIYCAKDHIVSRLPAFAQQASFKDICFAIEETVEDVRKQIERMRKIYVLLSVEPLMGPCLGLTALLDEAATAIQHENGDTMLRDMAILFYLQNIESTEVGSFQVLKMVARKLDNPEIDQLLLENFDEAQDDRNLLLELTKKYLPDNK